MKCARATQVPPLLMLFSVAISIPVPGCRSEDTALPFYCDDEPAYASYRYAACEHPRRLPCLMTGTELIDRSGNVNIASISNTILKSDQYGVYYDSVVDISQFVKTDSNTWSYLRFLSSGIESVQISDVDSLSFIDWDIGIRNRDIRLNGGDVGPGSAEAVDVRGASFDSNSFVPDQWEPDVENVFTDKCDIIADSHGLGDPDLLLSNWWNYDSMRECVQTTNDMYLISFSCGGFIKLVVKEYYQNGQDACNNFSKSGWAGPGVFRFQWQFLRVDSGCGPVS